MKSIVSIDKLQQIGKVEKNVFGSFVEHLGRCVYNGIYQPEHPTADKNGFRRDVIDLVKDLHTSLIRYPGGNFVSGFEWKDSIGPKRRECIDIAWEAVEPNIVGLDEFMNFAGKTGSEVMMSVNLGTGSIGECQEIVEYCNMEKAGYWAKQRIANGHKDPYKVHYWCLGNEMDGPWQICTKTAEEYGRLALEAAKIMKWVDPTIEVVACGSSSTANPTYPEWDRKVLEIAYDRVDYLSLHSYYSYPTPDHSMAEFMASPTGLENYIHTMRATCDYVKALKRSNKDILFALDEWNVWHMWDGTNETKVKWEYGLPRNENLYDYADAVVVGGLLTTIMNNSDRIKIACFAQLVNVIAPIYTDPNDKKGKVIKQTTYYPIKMAADAFIGKTTLRTVNMVPNGETKTYGKVPLLYTSVGYDEEKKEYAALLVNASDKVNSVQLDFGEAVEETSLVKLVSDNLKIKNTVDQPDNIVPQKEDVKTAKGHKHTIQMPKYSVYLVSFKA